jgi:hypothetical protein
MKDAHRLYVHLLFGLLPLVTSVGCAISGPRIPDGWESRPATPIDLKDGDQARLQIIVTYDLIGSHIVLRITGPQRQLIMWDPAGQFGLDGHGVQRKRDVIFDGVPTLDEYWTYRQQLSGSVSHKFAIYEYDIVDRQADELREPLFHETELFRTKTGSARCGLAASEFLMRFAKPTVRVCEQRFMPHHMMDKLMVNDPPSRLILYCDGWIVPRVYEQIRR